MADHHEGKESKFPKPREEADISDSESRRILRERERQLNLRLVSLRQEYSELVSTFSRKHGLKDDKGDEDKSNSPPKKDEESAAPPVVGVGRGRGRGRARNPPSSTPESVTLPAGPSSVPKPATSTKGPSSAPEIAPWLSGSSLIEKLMLAWDADTGEFPPCDPSNSEGGTEEGGEKSKSVGETEESASPPKGLGRGRGYRRPATPTPNQSPIPDEDVASPIAASFQLDNDREFTPPEQRTQERGKEAESSSKNEETGVDALPKPGIGRGRGRGKEKPPATPRSSRP